MIGSAPTLAPSDLVAVINQNFELALGQVTLEGELAEFKIRKEKWLYFKVKDTDATVDCFGTVFMMPGPLEDGMIVKVTGTPRLHPKFGFSFQARSIIPAGEGSLKKALELLKAKLESEGLFSDDRKRFLPYPPARVGVITSKEGAAIGDFEKVLAARWPFIDIHVKDVTVQGDNAAESVCSAIDHFNAMAELPEVLVIIRGGGSAEDLSAFNDERIVRAISASRVPTMVAIGHEQDVSLAELAADMRASTPSNAAELLAPDATSELQELEQLRLAVGQALAGFGGRIAGDIRASRQRLLTSVTGLLSDLRTQNSYLARELNLVDPKQVMKRGFSVVKSSGGVVRSAASLNEKDAVELVFYDGRKNAIIDK